MGLLHQPELEPGPHRDLVDALHRLHHEAGRPSLRAIARRAGCSHTTVHHLFTHPRLPAWSLLESGRAGDRGRPGRLPGPLARRDGGRRPAPASTRAHHRRPPRRAPRRTPPPRGRRRAAGRHRRARHRYDDAGGRGVAAGVDVRGPGGRAADPGRRPLRARVRRAAPGLARRRGPVVRPGAGPLPRLRGTGAVPHPPGGRTAGSRRGGPFRDRPPLRGGRVHPHRPVLAPSAGARARGPALVRSQLARVRRAARRRRAGCPDRRQPLHRRVRAGRCVADARASRGGAGAEPGSADPQGDPGAAAADRRAPAAPRRRRARPRAGPGACRCSPRSWRAR